MQLETDFVKLTGPVALAMGYFDGVHLGHRAVIGAAKAWAQSHGAKCAVFTFTLDDAGVARRGGDILSARERRRRIEALGADICICPPASAFYGKSPRWFVETVAGALGAKAVFCGGDFTFGKGREGDVPALRALCAPLGVEVNEVESVLWQGERVSSTRVRAALARGDMEAAGAMLGAPYSIDFEVVHGKKLGRTIGCPTLNQLYPAHILQPLQGVYAATVTLGGKVYAAATGFGTRPTVDGENPVPTAETFIKGFSGDLYGQRVRVELHEYLWGTRKFGSLDELAAMEHEAAARAEKYLPRP